MENTSRIIIRPAVAEDSPLIAHFQLKMAEETENLKLDPEVVHKGVTAVFNDPEKGKYWISEIEERPCGVMLTLREWSDWRNGSVLWIHSVYIMPEVRRRGIYAAMYGHIKNLVSKNPKLRGLRLYVDKSNETAQKTYQKLGMSDEHYTLYEWLK